jgi:hypothetical protein
MSAAVLTFVSGKMDVTFGGRFAADAPDYRSVAPSDLRAEPTNVAAI